MTPYRAILAARSSFETRSGRHGGCRRSPFEQCVNSHILPLDANAWFFDSFSLQVLNCNFPITDLEVSVDDSQTWEGTVRQDYNYFEKEEKSGFGKDTVAVRVTCSNGRQVIVPNVSMDPEREIIAPVNC